MVQKFWRVRLGAAMGPNGDEKLFNLCNNEKPACIVIGWGKIDLSKNITEIRRAYDKVWGSLEGHEEVMIKRWIAMEKGDVVVAMRRPAMICAIGKIIRERYHKKDTKFHIEIKGYDDPHKVLFFNRIDVEWITNPANHIKVKTLGLPKSLEAKLNIPMTVIELDKDEYDLLKDKINMY